MLLFYPKILTALVCLQTLCSCELEQTTPTKHTSDAYTAPSVRDQGVDTAEDYAEAFEQVVALQADLQTAANNNQNIQAQLGDTEQELAQAYEDIAQYKHTHAMQAQSYTGLERELAAAQANNQQLAQDKTATQSNISALEKRLQVKEYECNALQDALRRKKVENTGLRDVLVKSNLANEKSEAEKQEWELIRQALATNIDDLQGKISGLQDENNTLRREMDAENTHLRNVLVESNMANKKLEAEKQALEQAQTRQAAEIDTLKEEISGLQNEKNGLRREMDNVNSRNATLEAFMAEKENALESMKNDKKALEQHVAKLQAKVAEVEKTCKNQQTKLAEKNTKLAELEGELKTNQEELQQTQAALEQQQTAQKEAAKQHHEVNAQNETLKTKLQDSQKINIELENSMREKNSSLVEIETLNTSLHNQVIMLTEKLKNNERNYNEKINKKEKELLYLCRELKEYENKNELACDYFLNLNKSLDKYFKEITNHQSINLKEIEIDYQSNLNLEEINHNMNLIAENIKNHNKELSEKQDEINSKNIIIKEKDSQIKSFENEKENINKLLKTNRNEYNKNISELKNKNLELSERIKKCEEELSKENIITHLQKVTSGINDIKEKLEETETIEDNNKKSYKNICYNSLKHFHILFDFILKKETNNSNDFEEVFAFWKFKSEFKESKETLDNIFCCLTKKMVQKSQTL